MKVSREFLFDMIKEEHEQYQKDDELKDIGMDVANLLEFAEELYNKLEGMGRRYGEMAHVGTYARMVLNSSGTLSTKYNKALDNMSSSGYYKEGLDDRIAKFNQDQGYGAKGPGGFDPSQESPLGSPAPDPEQVYEKAQDQIERILNDLWDKTESNEILKKLLSRMIEDLDSGFIGEPT